MSADRAQVLTLPLSRRTALKAGMIGAAGFVSGPFPRSAGAASLSAQGQPGGQLVIGKPGDVSIFDPHLSAGQVSWEIHAVVYESLVFLDDSLSPVPGLAESWETPDDRTYVFKIREGVKFHNGREMTAEDVAFSLNRVLDPTAGGTGSWWAGQMGPQLPPDAVDVSAAATATALGTPTTAPTRIGLTIEATGPYEVTATLSEPYAPFLQALSATTTSIVPAAEVQNGEIDLETEMVGTGAFRVVEHIADQRWVFEAFPEYWQEGRPVLANLTWQIIPDESSRVAALRTGEIQLTTFDTPALLDVLANDPNVTTTEQLTTNIYILFVNATQPDLGDERVRQAISLAMDRAQLAEVALVGRAEVSGPTPAGFTRFATPIGELPFHTRDIEQARQLLTEAGYPNGLQLEIVVTPALAATVTMAEILREQLAEVGIQLTITQLDLATFVTRYNTEGTAQLAISWWAGYSDPYLLQVQLRSDDFGGVILGVADPELDALLDQAGSESDPAARVELIRAVEATIATHGHWQAIATRNNYIGYRNDLIGDVAFAAADGFGLPYWHRLQEMTRLQ